MESDVTSLHPRHMIPYVPSTFSMILLTCNKYMWREHNGTLSRKRYCTRCIMACFYDKTFDLTNLMEVPFELRRSILLERLYINLHVTMCKIIPSRRGVKIYPESLSDIRKTYPKVVSDLKKNFLG